MILKKVITQATVNTDLEVQIPTGLTVDGKQGWSISRFTANVNNIYTAAPLTANVWVSVQLNGESGNQAFDDNDSIAYAMLQYRGVTGATNGGQVTGFNEPVMLEPRVTVQPNLFIRISSIGATAVLSAQIQIEYEIVKLTDIEVMRLWRGGA